VRAWIGPRAYGYTTPANRISLVERPGCLRYYLAPMTHADGFLNGYQPTRDVHGAGTRDPGIELHHPLAGDHWLLEAKVSYFLPYTNGRVFHTRVLFGGGPAHPAPLYYVDFARCRAVNQNQQYIQLAACESPDAPRITPRWLERVLAPQYSIDDLSESLLWIRLRRAGSVLSTSWSSDGVAWQTAFTRDMETRLDGLDQRVILSGTAWFDAADSYADYHSVTVVGADGALA
jgi:hypothetical protein